MQIYLTVCLTHESYLYTHSMACANHMEGNWKDTQDV